MSKSCYILEVSVEPGSARRGDAFVYNSLNHLRKCIEQEFLSEDPDMRAYAASLSICYGATIVIWVVEQCRVIAAIDLQPFMAIRVQGEPPCAVLDAIRRDDVWKDSLSDGNTFQFEFDWKSVKKSVPKLRGDKLKPGESFELEQVDQAIASFPSYIHIMGELNCGYNDAEGGEDAPPEFVDPDPQ